MMRASVRQDGTVWFEEIRTVHHAWRIRKKLGFGEIHRGLFAEIPRKDILFVQMEFATQGGQVF